MTNHKLIAAQAYPSSYAIAWTIDRRGSHHVRYGKQHKKFIGPNRDIDAAQEFGLCVRHAAECEGLLDYDQ
jgi:hypothetical protein